MTYRILIVDDEPMVARSMQKTLVRAGYAVQTAPSCGTGWAVFEVAKPAFDLVLLDLNMPDFEGTATPDAGFSLLDKVAAARPGLPVIILSAYDDVNKARQAIARGARGFCVKGREQSLLDQIHAILPGEAPQ